MGNKNGINSNTTLVKVKLSLNFLFIMYLKNSNTTLVKVKSLKYANARFSD